MIELRSQINLRITSDLNVSLTMTHLLDDSTPLNDVHAAGRNDCAIVNCYLAGYGEKAGEESTR